MTLHKSIRLEFSDRRLPLTELAELNTAMEDIGCQVWPLDLREVPANIKILLGQPTLATAEAEQVKTHFLLPRERLLEIIQGAGREPQVLGGGELNTFVSNHGYPYPQLYVVQNDIDYSRFDRFHVNTANDGTGVDEVVQLLSGRGLAIHHRQHNGVVRTVRLACPSEDAGWLVTYSGGYPHIGSLRDASPGLKLLVQVIGPAEWVMRYVDDR